MVMLEKETKENQGKTSPGVTPTGNRSPAANGNLKDLNK